MGSQATRVLRRFLAETHTLDLAWVEGLRRDFLALLKNVDRVHTYRDLTVFREALRTFRAHFDDLVFENFINKEVSGLSSEDKFIAHWVKEELRSPAWSLSSSLTDVPGGYPDDYMNEEGCMVRYQQGAARWKARVQRDAQKFWAAMKKIISQLGRGIQVETPERYQTTLEGFQVVLIGYDEGYNKEERLEKLKAGLRLYRHRAAQVAPLLLTKQIPVLVEFKTALDQGGLWKPDGTITFYASSLGGKDYKWVTHVMAHEMGHQIFRTYLSQAQTDFWEQTIRGDFGYLDLGELLAKWPGDAWAFNFSETMKDDPILALQVESLIQVQEYADTQKKKDFQALYDSGQRKIRVPKTPITGYANKNPEEAFCETLGLLVAYGPQALHERVRRWFQTVMGNDVRVARALV